MDEYLQTNRALWDELTEINVTSAQYDVAGFLDGASSLKELDRQEVGDVQGKRLLHLQCHFGMDTLSWARLGAKVTGVDFSPKAITCAHSLRQRLGIPARFYESNLYALPDVLDEQFDIIYTSYGVLCWLPDLLRWGEIIAHYLAPGGFVYIADSHPLLQVFANDQDTTEFQVRYSYFHQREPTCWEPDGAYADRTQITTNPSYEWTHSLADILSALTSVKLVIEHFAEHKHLCWDFFPFMVKGDDNLWRLPETMPDLPLSFSLRARKPQ